jgi:hypothetical protein
MHSCILILSDLLLIVLISFDLLSCFMTYRFEICQGCNFWCWIEFWYRLTYFWYFNIAWPTIKRLNEMMGQVSDLGPRWRFCFCPSFPDRLIYAILYLNFKINASIFCFDFLRNILCQTVCVINERQFGRYIHIEYPSTNYLPNWHNMN